MFGNMIAGYGSNRDGLFGQDPLANGGVGSAINRPQDMMAAAAQPKKEGGSDLLSLISPLGSLLMGGDAGGGGRGMAGILGGLIPGLLAGKMGNNMLPMGAAAFGQGMKDGQGLPGQAGTWLNELFSGGQGANNAGFRQTPDGMPLGYYVRR